MASAADLESRITTVFNTTWNSRDGQVVPATDDVALTNGAVKLNAVVLYADLADSTTLARDFSRSVAAKVVRAYLSSVTRVILDCGGEVRSFDGDRVMGVFVGDSKNTSAADCALKINYAVTELLKPKAEAKFPSLVEKGFKIRHCTGVARSDVFVVRGGVRDNNDLVFVGSAPNIAAKLSDIRTSHRSYLTWQVFEKLHKSSKVSSKTGEDMWERVTRTIDGKDFTLYRSTWWRKP